MQSIFELFKNLKPQLIETKISPINQEIKVVKLFGSYNLIIDNLTQSGGILTDIWHSALKKSKLEKSPQQVLILGFGGGSAVRAIRKLWPQADVTGIEIDPIMIELGRKYLNVNTYQKVTIINTNVFNWLPKQKLIYDLILLDMYLGRNLPQAGETITFIQTLKRHLSPGGSIIFNRLIIGKQTKHHLFVEKLKKVFSTVYKIPTPANLFLKVSS